jgi:hypothetical protein
MTLILERREYIHSGKQTHMYTGTPFRRQTRRERGRGRVLWNNWHLLLSIALHNFMPVIVYHTTYVKGAANITQEQL